MRYSNDMSDLQTRFAEAQQALQGGDLDRAGEILEALVRQHPQQPALYHMTGLVLKKKGLADEALAAFEKGLGVNEAVPGLHAERASLLSDVGRAREAIAAYDRAIELAPDMLDARIDRAVVTHQHINARGGYQDLRPIWAEHPDHPRILLNLAIMARKIGELEESNDLTEKLLELAPENAKGLRLRAQLAFDRGEPSVDLFRRAEGVEPGNREAIAGLAAAMAEEESREEAESLLRDHLARDPGWHEGHHILAELKWQSGAGEAFIDSYRKAIAERPEDTILWSDMIVAIARALGHEKALPLFDQARAAAGNNEYFDNLEANSLCELGELEKAGRIYQRLEGFPDSNFRLPLIRFLVRQGDFAKVQQYGLELVDQGLGPDAWPYISIAWRMTDDPRWEWLEGDPRMTAAIDIAGLAPELPALADRLRSLHMSKVQPFEQSLRGGTQTSSVLFTRTDPEIRSLVSHIITAVGDYVAQLPPVDETHPVLSQPRGEIRFTGSWSVRLTDSGFHVSHYHNQGWISSALYVSLPNSIGQDGQSEDGWLALGEPPAEFDLGLKPLRLVEPKPGRLALFPSIMWHGTRPFGAGERLTVAFDVAPH